MATISSIRAGLATQLATISGLRTSATIPDNPNPPIALVQPLSLQFDSAFGRGMNQFNFAVQVIVGRADERTAQNRLDAFCSSTGASSIKLAIESDKSLGGAVFDTRVTELRNYGSVVISEVVYLSAEFNVICYAD